MNKECDLSSTLSFRPLPRMTGRRSVLRLVLLFNWNLLGDGEHEVVAFVDGEELGRAAVRVTTLGEEFLRGVEGECVVEDFPGLAQTVTLEWHQNSQNFVITAVD